MAQIIERSLKNIGGVDGCFYGVEADSYEEAKALIENYVPNDILILAALYEQTREEKEEEEALLPNWLDWD